METIKFRGKEINSNEWVYGDLIHGVGSKIGKMYILPNIINVAYAKPKHCHEIDGYTVIPETVGQFTVLHDKNRIEIYEGDKCIDEYCQIEGIIVFDKGCFGLKITKTSSKMYDLGQKQPMYEFLNLEVFGNIHDDK